LHRQLANRVVKLTKIKNLPYHHLSPMLKFTTSNFDKAKTVDETYNNIYNWVFMIN